MTEQNDCPICYDTLDFGGKNCMRTECGHEFHTSCIMTTIHNSGFKCPYCRETMVEGPTDNNHNVVEDANNELIQFYLDRVTFSRALHPFPVPTELPPVPPRPVCIRCGSKRNCVGLQQGPVFCKSTNKRALAYDRKL